MIDNSKALEMLRQHCEDCESDFYYACENCEFSAAIVALEKQKPDHVIHRKVKVVATGDNFNAYVCPRCGRSLRRMHEAHHCKCGQALDWYNIWTEKEGNKK